MSSTSSKTDRPRPLPKTVAVARVLRPHGVRGELIVEVLSDMPGRVAAGSELLLAPEAGPSRRVRIAAVRPLGGRLGVTLEGITDRTAAAALRGAWLEVERDRVPPAPGGTYYPYELVGCLCHDRRLGELGVAEELIADGGGLLLRISGARGELLVPFVETFLCGVDRAARRIELDLPAGLVEACASRS